MAIDQKYTDLINADIDGELSAAESAELQAYLAQDDEGRTLHKELSSLCSTLDAAEPLDPPPYLRHAIMGSLQPTRAKPESPSFLRTLFATPALTYAATFAAGVFLTLSLVNSGQLSNQAFDDVTGLVGTVADPIHADLESSVAVDEPQIAGTVALRSIGSILILDFDLVAANPIEIEADYDDRTMWFNGFAQLESNGTTVSADAGRVMVRMDGKRRYAVYLHNEDGLETTVSLRFVADGKVVHEASLDYAPAR